MNLPYTDEQSQKAYDDWQATCGHHSIAAASQRPLEDVRKAIPNYRGWMSPMQILKTLFHLKQGFHYRKDLHTQDIPDSPNPQILRLQFEGSWLNPGVPAAAAYHHTHYIAVLGNEVMDPMIDSSVLIDKSAWLETQDIRVTQSKPKATGWHFTHAWEIIN